ncbi:hypothetical protein ACFO4E_27925 [Nocardiopsis mangrovi]|uniref:Secreted protein n=1 Tax=Nocardiopsis mangrovi TaxID=1179818 RepID=A0ABV9E3E0_9ACTN
MNRFLACTAAAVAAAVTAFGAAAPASADDAPAAAPEKSCDSGLGGVTKHVGVKICPTLDGVKGR